jgi:hypothetical protein
LTTNEPRIRLSPETEFASALILEFLDSIKIENKQFMAFYYNNPCGLQPDFRIHYAQF